MVTASPPLQRSQTPKGLEGDGTNVESCPSLKRSGFNEAKPRRVWKAGELGTSRPPRHASTKPNPEGFGRRRSLATSHQRTPASTKPNPEGFGRLAMSTQRRNAGRGQHPERFNEAKPRRVWKEDVGKVTPALRASTKPNPEGFGRRIVRSRDSKSIRFNEAKPRRVWKGPGSQSSVFAGKNHGFASGW